jgi:mono/diheme cytochrome c family protein
MRKLIDRPRNLVFLASIAATIGLSTGQVAVHADAGAPEHGTQTPATTKAADPDAASSEFYAKHCAVCHGDRREGNPPAVPPLVNIKHQMTDQQIAQLIREGRGRMPGFPKLNDDELTGLLQYLATAPDASPVLARNRHAMHELTGEAAAGGALFAQNCAFCHGRDAMGGETGPDLTLSKLVLADTDGSKISDVVTEGRVEKRMPAFQFSSQELLTLVAFLRSRVAAAAAMKGRRRGVEVSDLQTGDADSGRMYFEGAGGCAKCHSPTGDLAGIARRFEGLQLEMRMLYPKDAKSTVDVTLPSGQTITGTLVYLDEFTVGLRDKDGAYHSWAVEHVKFTVDSPVQAHVEQLAKYTDEDIHNLMAYLQTLR